MFAKLRKGLLLYLLVVIALGTWWTQRRVASWEGTLWVAIHPINADGSEASRRWIASLEPGAFDEIEAFLNAEAKRHGVSFARSVDVTLGAPVSEQPPAPPRGGNVLSVMAWSLQLRWWAWRVDRGPDPPHADVSLFVRYFDPQTTATVAHSLGLREGMIGVVNAFATRHQAGSNRVIIAHELMHTLRRAALPAAAGRAHGRPRAALGDALGDAGLAGGGRGRAADGARDRLGRRGVTGRRG